MKTVVIFEAGATNACGGPLTKKILPAAYGPDIQDRGQFLLSVEQFLSELFFLPPRPVRRQQDFPPLPLLLSLIGPSRCSVLLSACRNVLQGTEMELSSGVRNRAD